VAEVKVLERLLEDLCHLIKLGRGNAQVPMRHSQTLPGLVGGPSQNMAQELGLVIDELGHISALKVVF
jgi:hypothetical protein